MEIITGHIKEVKERITGAVIEYCASAPVLVKDSAGTLLYTKNSGETATVTDSLIKDSAGTTLHSVKAQASQTITDTEIRDSAGTLLYTVKAEGADTTITDTLIKDSAGVILHTVKAQGPVTTIPDVIVKNSENTTIATIKAEAAPTTITDITVTNPITGATYPWPAKKDLTESTYKEIEMEFLATYADTLSRTITAKSAGVFANETLTNCTVVYTVNAVVKTLPFTVVNTDILTETITRTNPALYASVVITT